MSYDIIYERQFVRLPDDRIIPLVLVGSNNVIESIWSGTRSYDRRAREWSPFINGTGRVAFTREELEEYIDSCVPSSFNQHFKYHSKWVDDEGFIRFIRNGINSAKTLEELTELNSGIAVTLDCRVAVYTYKSEATSNGYRPTTRHDEFSCSALNSQLLTEFVDEAESREKAEDEECALFIVRFMGEKAVPYPRKKPKRNTGAARDAAIQSGTFFVIANNRGDYLYRLTRYGYQYTPYASAGKVFATEPAAQRYLNTNRSRISFKGAEWEVKKIELN